MRLATYQPTEETKALCGDKYNSGAYRKLQERLGYYPIFCISAENLPDLMVQSLLAAPWCPQEIVFFETDDYHKYNVVKSGNTEFCFLDEEAGDDIRCLEYIVEKIPDNAERYNLYENLMETKEMQFVDVSGDSINELKEAANIIVDQGLAVIKRTMASDNYYKTHEVLEDFYEPGSEMQPLLELLKMAFVSATLGFCYDDWMGEKNPDNEPFLLVPVGVISAFQNRIAYAYNEKQTSEEEHIELYEDIKKYLRANSVLSIKTRAMNPPSTYDPCPCGSGAKYKFCCKPYVLA